MPRGRKRGMHHPGCDALALGPASAHIEGCRYRTRKGGNIGPDVQHRPRLWQDEADAFARAKERGVSVIRALNRGKPATVELPRTKADVQRRPRMTAKEATAFVRAKQRGVDIVQALDSTTPLQK